MTDNHTTDTTSAEATAPVVVIGAGGKTGRRVTERLVAAGRPVRAASRSSETRFDWDDPSTWTPALAGAGAAYITYHPDLALPGAAETIGAFADVAVANGVRRLVLLSGRGEEGAQRAEALVQRSGAAWTIVRCAFFAQNFSETFAEPIRNGILSLPGEDNPEPYVDADDIADVVVAALSDDRHHGQVYELTGPRLLTLAEVASILSAATGHPVRYVPTTVAAFGAGLAAAGMPEAMAGPIASLIAEVRDGRNAYLTDGVERALGRPARDLADYARDAAASGIWSREVTA